MTDPTPPCCEAWPAWVDDAAWYALEDEPAVLVMDDHFHPTSTMSTDPTSRATSPAVTKGTTLGRYSVSVPPFTTGPHAWRLARKNGELILQGLMWTKDKGGVQYWETIPTIDLTNEESES